jgi:multidrug resistance efflux pump/GAF domain-containing protein
MEQIKEDFSEDMRAPLEEVDRLRNFDGPPGAFWHRFLACGAGLVRAKFGLLLMQDDAEEAWKRLCVWPSVGPGFPKSADFVAKVEAVACQAAETGLGWGRAAVDRNVTWLVQAVRLDVEKESERVSVAVFFIDGRSEADPDENNVRLKLLADLPTLYQLGRLLKKAESDVVQFAEALDLMVMLNAETRYMAAAMTFCNEIAARYRCQRVSLGWLQGGYVRLQAISHMENFEKKMDAVQAIEAAMEEAFDQDEEIVWPRPEDSNTVVGNHESFAREQGVGNMLSLPIRLGGEPVAVLSCERAGAAFSEIDVNGIRVLCDQAARRLDDLRNNDRWFGAKWAQAFKDSLAGFLGVEHTFAKFLGVLIALALGILIFGKWEYRVEAPFILKTDDLMYLPAPFDGYIDEVKVQVGDLVGKNDLLLTLDTQELLLEESSALANRSRYMREAEKARAENDLAEMKIALAMQAQAEAQLQMVRYHLDNARVRAPFDGIVVEGDLKKMLGAPVRKGDILFKVALIEKMYAEIDVDERDIHEIGDGFEGEIAFVSRPKLKFPVNVEQIDPVAVAKEEGNVFVLRGIFPDEIAEWWRPGMSGIAKINVGRRNLLWIFTHRTVEFFRLFLWW